MFDGPSTRHGRNGPRTGASGGAAAASGGAAAGGGWQPNLYYGVQRSNPAGAEYPADSEWSPGWSKAPEKEDRRYAQRSNEGYNGKGSNGGWSGSFERDDQRPVQRGNDGLGNNGSWANYSSQRADPFGAAGPAKGTRADPFGAAGPADASKFGQSDQRSMTGAAKYVPPHVRNNANTNSTSADTGSRYEADHSFGDGYGRDHKGTWSRYENDNSFGNGYGYDQKAIVNGHSKSGGKGDVNGHSKSGGKGDVNGHSKSSGKGDYSGKASQSSNAQSMKGRAFDDQAPSPSGAPGKGRKGNPEPPHKGNPGKGNDQGYNAQSSQHYDEPSPPGKSGKAAKGKGDAGKTGEQNSIWAQGGSSQLKPFRLK